MANLIYFAIGNNYKDCLFICLNQLVKYSNADICCISSESFALDNLNIKTYILNDFDYKYSARFNIVNWEYFDNYENFLYLDSDVLCYKKTDDIFNDIQNQPDIVHGVRELQSIQETTDEMFRLSQNPLPVSCAYNSGSFGFNKKIKPVFSEFLRFIEQNKSIAINDQPLFNEFFIARKIIGPTLSKYVYLEGRQYEPINIIKQKDAVIRHFVCGYGNSKSKCSRMEEALNGTN